MTDEAKRPMADRMEGWVVAPLRATHAMEEAGHSRLADDGTLADLYDAMLAGAPARPASEAVARLVEAALVFAKTNPAFRSRPVGADGSIVREQQHDKMKAEDALYDALAPFLPKENNIHD